jgi:hypothetical protein
VGEDAGLADVSDVVRYLAQKGGQQGITPGSSQIDRKDRREDSKMKMAKGRRVQFSSTDFYWVF